MITCHFVVRLDQPPVDHQIAQLLGRVDDLCVEVGAFRRWAVVHVDRVAPSLASAIASVVAEFDRVGLRAIEVGPDEDLITIPLIAERLAVSPSVVRRWAAHDHRAAGFPRPVVPALPSRSGTDAPSVPCYRWSAVAPWAATRLGLAVPETEPTLAAANFVIRLREIVPCVPGAAALVSLLPSLMWPGRGRPRHQGRTRRPWLRGRRRPTPPG